MLIWILTVRDDDVEIHSEMLIWRFDKSYKDERGGGESDRKTDRPTYTERECVCVCVFVCVCPTGLASKFFSNLVKIQALYIASAC